LLNILNVDKPPDIFKAIMSEELQQKIKDQGDVVRKLKEQKAEKSKVKTGCLEVNICLS